MNNYNFKKSDKSLVAIEAPSIEDAMKEAKQKYKIESLPEGYTEKDLKEEKKDKK